jgi:hypothetical protein
MPLNDDDGLENFHLGEGEEVLCTQWGRLDG